MIRAPRTRWFRARRWTWRAAIIPDHWLIGVERDLQSDVFCFWPLPCVCIAVGRR